MKAICNSILMIIILTAVSGLFGRGGIWAHWEYRALFFAGFFILLFGLIFLFSWLSQSSKKTKPVEAPPPSSAPPKDTKDIIDVEYEEIPLDELDCRAKTQLKEKDIPPRS